MGHWGHFCNWSTKEAVTSNSVMTPLYLLLSAPSGWYFLQKPSGGRALTFFKEGISNCKVPSKSTNVYCHQLSRQIKWKRDGEHLQTLPVSMASLQGLLLMFVNL